VVYPKTTNEVANIMKILSRGGDDVLFAFTSGGCMSDAGSANAKGGVTINLSKMNQVTVHKEKDVVSVGSGARWGEVYEVLEPLGITVLGGRVQSVGVGGLITGGTSLLIIAATNPVYLLTKELTIFFYRRYLIIECTTRTCLR
jgi:FAD/FMN-containing dehydrogenase